MLNFSLNASVNFHNFQQKNNQELSERKNWTSAFKYRYKKKI